MTEEKLPKKPPMKMELKVDDAIAAGSYANLCIVNHSDTEFVMDFVFIQPGRPKAKVNNRIILSPKNAKRFQLLLAQQVANYEKRFGELNIKPPHMDPLPEMEIN